jgi:quinol monooxygenase YgiN
MQTVGAQWYLADVGASATVVSLVQTTAMLPVFVFGLLAGVIADRVDRRILLLVVQGSAMAVFLLVFFGGQAFGSVIWGAVATWLSLRGSLLISAALLLGSGVVTQWWGLRPMVGVNPVVDEGPSLEDGLDELLEQGGHVLLVVEYDVTPDNVDVFRDALPRLGQSRRRTGAQRWAAYQDTAVPTRFVETYELPSWSEHVSQTTYRQTRGENQLVADVLALVEQTVTRRTLVGVAAAARGSARPIQPAVTSHSGQSAT